MREIKFRAWDEIDKKMIPMDRGRYDRDSGSLKFYLQYIPNRDSHLKFMVFTGLKDREGNDIYEGDVVEQFYKGATRFVVIWDEVEKDRWNLKAKDSSYYDNGDYYEGSNGRNWKTFKIIGNIYENPELIK